ncbi:AN1-type zinc finger protein 1-like isoform X2 [Lycorma delicatula]
MELPQLGEHCSHPDCKQLDFLPTPCALCNLMYCKDHFSPISHSCPKQINNIVTSKVASESFKCNYKDCSTSTAVEMLCTKCHQNFCVTHRHHACQEISKKDVDKWRAPKEQFKKVKAETDKLVEERLRMAQQSSPSKQRLVNKIKLMKIKGKAFGDNRIPETDRVFFLVYYPYTEGTSKESRPLFVSKTWSVGRAIDFFAKRMKVENNNNVEDAPKLRLFLKDSGNLITHQMDTVLETILNDQVIINGDSLVIEYVEPDIVNQCAFIQISSEKYS